MFSMSENHRRKLILLIYCNAYLINFGDSKRSQDTVFANDPVEPQQFYISHFVWQVVGERTWKCKAWGFTC